MRMTCHAQSTRRFGPGLVLHNLWGGSDIPRINSGSRCNAQDCRCPVGLRVGHARHVTSVVGADPGLEIVQLLDENGRLTEALASTILSLVQLNFLSFPFGRHLAVSGERTGFLIHDR